MSKRAQAGTTLVELMISLAVTATVLVALVGVVFAAGNLTTAWSQRIYDSNASGLLPGRIQADAHRYLVCGSGSTELDFCTPGGTRVVSYTSTTPCPCDVLRQVGWQDSGGVSHVAKLEIVGRHLVSRPSFLAQCTSDSQTANGYVLIKQLQYQGDVVSQPDQTIFFRSPDGSCG